MTIGRKQLFAELVILAESDLTVQLRGMDADDRKVIYLKDDDVDLPVMDEERVA